ncbi:hypothetical protein [Streptomyces sp. NEAU-W12]|uniref:hypothetical protein n=1 Tax=Streptomyces sp. NEAU-W12 TaxID=2994668 RepID=UPI00224A495E|nr:hypothetical protein [Streptomyces sp. NEAU-W12]MCX2927889.1 hypothetical protein [Streptomyces sp. NEAU-W12]
MSLTSIGRALNAPADITPTERLLLVHLARDAAGDEMMSTSIRHLAARTNTSLFTVTRSLRRLAELKLDQRGHFSDVTGRPSPAWCVRLPALTGNGSTRGGPA